MNGYQIQARRHAREVAADMRWQGMTVPPLYAQLTGEFEDLVRSGDYATWVAASQKPAPTAGRSHLADVVHVRAAPAGRVARRWRLLPGPVLGR